MWGGAVQQVQAQRRTASSCSIRAVKPTDESLASTAKGICNQTCQKVTEPSASVVCFASVFVSSYYMHGLLFTQHLHKQPTGTVAAP